MLKIAICDDNIQYLSKIKLLSEQYLKSLNIKYEIHIFQNSTDLLKNILLQPYDIVFLDVEMYPLNGIDTGAKIREIMPNVILVYISAYIDYAIKGYKVNAFRYILKKDLDNSFVEDFDSIMVEYNRINEYFTFKKNGEPIKVLYKDIIYIMSDGRKVILFEKNDNQHELYAKLDDIEKIFENKYFLRIHQSYMVNLRYTLKLKNYTLSLTNGLALPTSKKNFRALKEKYTRLKGAL